MIFHIIILITVVLLLLIDSITLIILLSKDENKPVLRSKPSGQGRVVYMDNKHEEKIAKSNE